MIRLAIWGTLFGVGLWCGIEAHRIVMDDSPNILGRTSRILSMVSDTVSRLSLPSITLTVVP